MVTDEGTPVLPGWQIVQLAARLLLSEIDAALIDSLFVAQGGLVDEAGDLSFVLLDRELVGLRRDAALEELAVEYARLFVGPNPVCPPYASANGSSVLLGGRPAREVDAVMARHGLELPSDWRVVASDHFAEQVSVFEALEARRVRGEIQPEPCTEFFLRFVRPWAPDFLRSVAASARWAPYRTIPAAASEVLEGWLESSAQHRPLHS